MCCHMIKRHVCKTPEGLNRIQVTAFQSGQQQIRGTYGPMTFANLDGITVRFSPSCQSRPMQRALIHRAEAAIAFQRTCGTLRKHLQSEPQLLEARSPFGRKDGLETNVPQYALGKTQA